MKRFLNVVTIVVLLAGLLMSATPVLADWPTPPPPQQNNTWLEKGLVNAKILLEKQQASLDKATTKDVPDTQAYIDKKKAEGKDTAAMEAALAAFVAKLPAIQVKLDEAAAILAEHKGYDVDGKVTDQWLAMETFWGITGNAMEAAGELTEARFELYKVVGDWKKIEASLPRDYRKLKLANKLQEKKLAYTEKVVTRTQKYIDKQAAAGKDVTDLNTAVAAYKAKVAEAQVKHDEAAAILTTHAGFDDHGQVIDQAAAQTTVDTAKAALLEADKLVNQAYNELMTAMAAWKKTH